MIALTFDFEMCVYRERERAEEAVQRLYDLGTNFDDIGVIKRRENVPSLLVAGPIAADLACLAAGADRADIVCTLVVLGLTEQRASEYERAIRDGAILLAVRPKSSEHRDEVRRALGVRQSTLGAIEPSVVGEALRA